MSVEEHQPVKLPKGFKPYGLLIKNAEARVTSEWQPFLTWYRSLSPAVKETADDSGILPYNTPQIFASLYERITITERVAGHLTGIYPSYDEALQRDPAEVKMQSEVEVQESRKKPLSTITRLRFWLHR